MKPFFGSFNVTDALTMSIENRGWNPSPAKPCPIALAYRHGGLSSSAAPRHDHHQRPVRHPSSAPARRLVSRVGCPRDDTYVWPTVENAEAPPDRAIRASPSFMMIIIENKGPLWTCSLPPHAISAVPVSLTLPFGLFSTTAS